MNANSINSPPTNSLTCADKKELLCRLLARRRKVNRVKRCFGRRDPWSFITSFCYTLDSHDRSDPVKLFPNRPYLARLTRLWLDYPLLVVAKSRQMMATWLFVCLYLWEAVHVPGRLIFLQSKREEDATGNPNAAAGLLGRTRFVLEHLPAHVRPEFHATVNKIELPQTRSTLWAVPQGPDVLRQHTASGILSDEMAFQYLAEDAYTAAIPTIENGGRFTAISTANPGFFQKLFQDQL